MPPAQLGSQAHATMPGLLIKMDVSLTFCPGWPQIAILLISTSQTHKKYLIEMSKEYNVPFLCVHLFITIFVCKPMSMMKIYFVL
jgi:hypothetical protein